jgi:hypothetical protein
VLIALLEHEGGMSLAALAERLQWFMANGLPYKTKVTRVVDSLRCEKLVAKERGTPTLTEKGKKAANKALYDRDAAGASYG